MSVSAMLTSQKEIHPMKLRREEELNQSFGRMNDRWRIGRNKIRWCRLVRHIMDPTVMTLFDHKRADPIFFHKQRKYKRLLPVVVHWLLAE